MLRIRTGRNFSRTAPGVRVVKNNEVRLRFARVGIFTLGAILIARLFIIQVIDAKVYRALASEQREIYRELFPERGEILIRDGKNAGLTPLATNKDVYLVYADPRLIANPQSVADKLAPLLGIEENGKCKMENGKCAEGEAEMKISKYQELLERLSKSDDPYEPLAHGVEEDQVAQIRELTIVGIDAVREPKRYYPLKNIGAHLAGFVGSDGEKIAGRYGLEGTFEEELAGIPGFFEGEKDVAGRWIPVGRRTLKSAINGGAIVLTVDRAVEYFACTKLNEAVKRHGASGGVVVIMEVKTGKILAMCGAPDFDPNDYSAVEDISVFQNLATAAQYEPGSVFKVFTMASALDTGEVAPETTYEDTGQVKIGPHLIQNSDYKAHGVATMTRVLEESLNTGAIYASRKVGRERFRDYIERFGFGNSTKVGLNQEAKGDISALQNRGEIYLATASFGQGLSVTAMQLAQAVGAIANQGKLMQPYLVAEIRKSNGAAVTTSPTTVREVITPRAATLLSGMMVSVVERGHGKRAGVPGYFVAGKTGTAQIPRTDGKGYEADATIGTFVGFAPVEDPKFVMLTRIDRPKDVQFAESSAAPLFGEIARFLLQYFEVKPTRPVSNR